MASQEEGSGEACFSMGKHTLSVPMKLFSTNRERLCEKLLEYKCDPNAIILLQGGQTNPFYDTDIEYNVFRQEPYFWWAFGVNVAGCLGVMRVSDGGRCTLIVPRYPPEYSVWMGELPTEQQYRRKYAVDDVIYVDQMSDYLKSLSPSVLLTLSGLNTDSDLICKEAYFEGIENFKVDNTMLHHCMAECRVFKTDLERGVMRYAAKVSSDAHKEVMRTIHPGAYEYQSEATFLKYAYAQGGCRHVAYTCICASGPNGAILHYGHAGQPNDKQLLDGDMCSFDMGASYAGYASDITVSYPVNGKFTVDQRNIYNAVLDANLSVQRAMKPGVSWVDMHLLANRTLLEALKKLNIVKGDIEGMINDGVAALFQPHGLGHLLGVDVHDVGGYLEGCPPRPEAPGLKNLRTARILQAGMAVTVEPGCYFIKSVLSEAMENPKLSKYLNAVELKRFENFGGIRIEDDVFVTETGIENYTYVPRTVEEIEKWMAGEEYC